MQAPKDSSSNRDQKIGGNPDLEELPGQRVGQDEAGLANHALAVRVSATSLDEPVKLRLAPRVKALSAWVPPAGLTP